jgi:hypothetical protein
MLESVKGEVSLAGCVGVSMDGYDAAFFVESVAFGAVIRGARERGSNGARRVHA